MDPKVFQSNLFEPNKKPTKTLDALLRGLAAYIVTNIGDRQVDCLTPAKLAAFYREVGGNYDSLFVDATHRTMSYIYQTTGCQHSLQPTFDNYAAPSVPALTPKGFVRWQSLELLLDPQEHVEFIQRAVRTFPIKHPETGEDFPSELPSTSLPTESDPQVERWHRQCAEKLRDEAAPAEHEQFDETLDLPLRFAAQPRYSHMRERSPKLHSDTKNDYFATKPTPQQGPSRSQSHRGPQRPSVNIRPSFFYSTNQHIYGVSVPPIREPRPRRRSFQDENLSFSSPNLASPSPEQPESRKVPRGQSQPPYRHPSVASISSLSSEENPQVTPMPAHSQQSYPVHALPRETHNIRFNVGSVPSSPVGARRSHQTTPRHSPHRSLRNSDHRSHDSSNTYKPRRQTVHTDGSGGLSAQFLGPGTAGKRNNSRGSNVRWSAVNDVSEFSGDGRRGSTSADEGGRKMYEYGHSRGYGGRGGRDERPVREGKRGGEREWEREGRRDKRGGNDGEGKVKGWKRFVSPILGTSDSRRYAEPGR